MQCCGALHGLVVDGGGQGRRTTNVAATAALLHRHVFYVYVDNFPLTLGLTLATITIIL